MADIRKNEDASRWEAVADGAVVGHVVAEHDGGVVSLTHTEVDPAHGGKGIAGALVKAALDDIRADGGQVRPVCPYVVSWIDRHPDYADLVHPEGS